MTAPHLAVAIATSIALGVALSVLSGLPRAVQLWLARRRNQRIIAGRARPARLDINDICGMKCPGGSEERKCGCRGPKDCVMQRGGTR
jgi:hypothetical protein